MIQLTVNDEYCKSDLRSINEYLELAIRTREQYADQVDGYMGIVRGEHDKDIKIQVIAVDKGEYNELSVGLIKRMSESKGLQTALKGDGSSFL